MILRPWNATEPAWRLLSESRRPRRRGRHRGGALLPRRRCQGGAARRHRTRTVADAEGHRRRPRRRVRDESAAGRGDGVEDHVATGRSTVPAFPTTTSTGRETVFRRATVSSGAVATENPPSLSTMSPEKRKRGWSSGSRLPASVSEYARQS